MRQVQEEKTARKAECEAIIEQCIATIDQATKEVADAKAYLVLLLEDRKKFAAAFKERVSLRKKEAAATQAALDALQAVSAGAKENVESFLQTSMKTTAKVGAKAKARMMAKLNKLLPKLTELGTDLNSPSLIQMSTVLRSMSHAMQKFDPYMEDQQKTFFDQGKFGPVLKLLNDLILRLEEEQAAESSQHEWCETEKESSVAAKEEREKTIQDLMMSIDSTSTTIKKLKEEIIFLESEIARVKEETRIAKEIRKEEHAVFVQAKADHEEVIKAIGIALEALSGQYAFIQLGAKHRTRQPGGGEIGSTPFAEYKSGSAGAGSAMEMLEDLQARYTEALETLIAEENAAQKAHEELLKRNAKFIKETTYTKNEKLKERRGAPETQRKVHQGDNLHKERETQGT